MPARAAIFGVILLGSALYISILNKSSVMLRLTESYSIEASPTMLIVGGALVGALILTLLNFFDLARLAGQSLSRARARRRQDQFDDALARARAAETAGETKSAMSLYKRAGKLSKTDPLPWIRYGALAREAISPQVGLEAHERAAKIAPLNIEALFELERSLRMVGDHDRAVKVTHAALDRLGPKAPILRRLRDLALERSDYGEAVKVQNSILSSVPRAGRESERAILDELRLRLGISQLKLGERETALETLRSVADDGKGSLMAILKLVEVDRASGADYAALLERAFKLRGEPLLAFKMAELYRADGTLDRFINKLLASSWLEAKDERAALLNLALVYGYLRKGDFSQARLRFSSIGELPVRWESMKVALKGAIDLKDGNINQAADALEESLDSAIGAVSRELEERYLKRCEFQNV